MTRGIPLFALLGFCGCCHAAPALPTPAPPPAAMSANAQAPAIPPASESGNPCGTATVPALSAGPKAWPPELCADHRAIEPEITKAIRARYNSYQGRGQTDVQFGCDPLINQVDRVVFEVGKSGEGNLDFHELRLAEDHESYVVTIFRVPTNGEPPDDQVWFGRGKLNAAETHRVLTKTRATLAATIRELATERFPGSRHTPGVIHVWVSMSDEAYFLRGGYTGDFRDAKQRNYLPAQLATEQLAALVKPIHLDSVTIGDEHRRFITEYVRDAWPRLDRTAAYHVRRSLLTLLANAGTREALPVFIDELRGALAEPAVFGQTAEHDLSAIAKISGWDPTDGGKRDRESAAALAIEQCSKLFTASPAAE